MLTLSQFEESTLKQTVADLQHYCRLDTVSMVLIVEPGGAAGLA